MRRNSVSSTSPPTGPTPPTPVTTVPVWLPKSREAVHEILDAYFSRLNFHRPVLLREDFESTIDRLYKGEAVPHDPGFVCSSYLVFALGTLSELNHRVGKLESNGQSATSVGPNMQGLMPPDWPEHEEFFQLALSVKPDLRVTVSSLQALILLHWYLYTEVSNSHETTPRASPCIGHGPLTTRTATGTHALASGRQSGPARDRVGVAPRPHLARQRVLSGRMSASYPSVGDRACA